MRVDSSTFLGVAVSVSKELHHGMPAEDEHTSNQIVYLRLISDSTYTSPCAPFPCLPSPLVLTAL